MRLRWKALLGILVSALLLWWIFRGEDPAAIWAEIRGADPWMLLLAVAAVTVTYFIRAFRWHVLLTPLRSDTTFRSRFAAVCIGFMANNLLPARAGEFARAYALSRLEPVSVSGSFGSLVVERTLDTVAILLLLLVALASPAFPANPTVLGQPLEAVLRGVWVVLAVLFLALVLLVAWPRGVVGAAEAVAVRLPGNLSRLVVDVLKAFLDGLGALQSPRLMIVATAWSLLLWLWNSLAFWIAFRAFGIEQGFVAALFLNAAVALFVAVPSAPGFFGTYHAAVKVGLGEVFGVPAEATLSYAVGFHLGGFVPVTVLGLYYAWRLGFSLRDVKDSDTRVEVAVEQAHPPGSGGGEPGSGAGA